ncbi:MULTISPECIES: aminotransferase class I/II-fold pyridoxal phosphate-dependent enzyme [Aminobacterium]|jgi:aspartate/methionine/tyrosine aminotransferase|uniref:Aminotransferase n=1 Tax=Aminobacterium colombiense (strain DSM 12261 / ALA-1) TaxID=572547 RepID=D5ECM5_AMICL|nr:MULTISPECIES: aminotransferase class I/II-fold pyridoxal phosphate-dependent enzyme [Aminobacterium]MDD2379563.1 aminotransferase class I/II-fold pyridoxal phosphate-dependent enzyme [Aminobacterium colombiense]ADE56307.1 aminotransferase class I and II [Aminobacterium colombiense DSM 12261]MDD3768328.1 aminotransferase class I/II-fold pyridoxal phosphate-dependent enzyme [Aminobacterium colombiense]MDD4585982.1 aminotransferase class I/II-fold pyridoxal phosphate-dependent enzyme [Aminobact
MKLPAFKIERYFARYEFKTEFLLCPSDCESFSLSELLQMADTESLSLWKNLRLGYTESLGHPLLREEIAALYTGLSKEDVLLAVPEEGIFLAFNGILEPGDHVIAISPAYQSLYSIPEGMGCEVSYWSVKEKNGEWTLDLDELEGMIRPATKMIVVNFPHNPTGYLPEKKDFLKIVDIASRHDLYLFSDEMYRFLEFDEMSRLPSACTVYEKAVTLGGLSKAFGLPGLRMGWLAAQDREILNITAQLKDYTTICGSSPSEILSLMSLRAKEKILQRNRALIASNLEEIETLFHKHDDLLHWVPPKGGSIAFPALKGNIPIEAFCQEAIDQYGVLIIPGTLFGSKENRFRVGFGRATFSEALKQFEVFLNNRKG